MDAYTIDFHVKGRIITLDESTLPPEGLIGDNTDYFARFVFEDNEWSEYDYKTARFIHQGKPENILFEGDTCEIPLSIMKGGLLDVGVFAGNQRATTAAKIMIRPSCLDKDGPPPDPVPEIYAQLMNKLNNLEEAAPTIVNIWSEEDFKE